MILLEKRKRSRGNVLKNQELYRRLHRLNKKPETGPRQARLSEILLGDMKTYLAQILLKELFIKKMMMKEKLQNLMKRNWGTRRTVVRN
jgi:hypothetical protein